VTPTLRPFLALAGLLAALSGLAASKETGPRGGRWAHEEFGQKPDPRVIWGRLDNGFRYALLPHHGAPGRVAMKLLVLTGSMDERPDELGIAHFIEHMSFHGTRVMDEAAMLSLFRRAGLEYGSDVNAVTTFDHTAYSLDFSDPSPALLAEGVRWFEGVADGVTFNQADIDRERRVIFAEKRNREGLSDQQMQAAFPVVFRGAAFADHIPIGTASTLRALQRPQFLDFYQRGYRPDLMVFVVAGDIDPAAVEQLVRTQFGQIPRRITPVPPRREGRPALRDLRAGVFRIPGIGSAESMVACVTPQLPPNDVRRATIETQRRKFVMELFNDRLKFILPGAGDHQADFKSLLGYDAVSASVRGDGRQWSKSLLGVDLAVRETLRRGFEASEIEPLRRRYLDVVAHMAEQLPVNDPVDLCDELLDSITDHQVFVGPETEYAWMREWLQSLTVAEVNQTFRSLWNPEEFTFYESGDVALDLDAGKILQAVQKHRRGELAFLLPTPPKDIDFQLRHPGSPTPVVAREPVPELGATLFRFGNNVRLNLVPNKQEPGIVHATVRVGSGLLNLPGSSPALKEFGLNTLIGSGTIYYQTDQILQIIDQDFLDFSFDVADHDAFTFRGTVGTAKLETFLGLTTEILRDPKFNSYAHEDERARAYMSRASGAIGMGQGMREMMDDLFRGDPRFMSGTPLDYISLGVADVRRWMEEPLTKGYIEVTIIGDVAEADATAILGRTLGSLPMRAAEKVLPEPPKPVKLSAPPGYRRFEFVGELNVGQVVGNWPVEGRLDARAQAALQVLTKIVELRVRESVREDLGLSYAPSASFKPFGGFEDFALLQANVDCTPADAGEVAKAVTAAADKLATGGATAEELEGARGIIRRLLHRSFRDNNFLTTVLKRVQEHPDRIKDIVALRDGLVDQLTLAEVNGWAAKVLPAANCRTDAIVPKAFVGLFDGSK